MWISIISMQGTGLLLTFFCRNKNFYVSLAKLFFEKIFFHCKNGSDKAGAFVAHFFGILTGCLRNAD